MGRPLVLACSADLADSTAISGFSKSIVAAVIKVVGRERAMLSIVLVCLVLTYGGVSLFVVVFAVCLAGTAIATCAQGGSSLLISADRQRAVLILVICFGASRLVNRLRRRYAL